MNRETSNRIRYVLEELLPPALKDSGLFRGVASVAFGGDLIRGAAAFRSRAPFLTEDEYTEFYRNWPRVHDMTDNSAACIKRIVSDIRGTSICDVGCGSGYLLRSIRDSSPTLQRLVGVDIVPPAAEEGLEFIPGHIEQLPFADAEFDTVLCTHTIEHILAYHEAIAELRRITRRRLVIVVPLERESIYTFNPHFNFFPYPHSFLRAMAPVPTAHVCERIGRDIYYREDLDKEA